MYCALRWNEDWEGSPSLWIQSNVIAWRYSDSRRLEDGCFFRSRRGKVNRVTRAVFDHFTKTHGKLSLTGEVTDIIAPGMQSGYVKVKPDEDACGPAPTKGRSSGWFRMRSEDSRSFSRTNY